MNNIKTAMLSILRRPGKSAILLLVIAITCSLVSGVVLVQRGVEQTSEAAKQELGATITLNVDYEAVMEAYESSFSEPEIPDLDTSLIESLGARPEVKYFDYCQEVYLTSKELKQYSVMQVDEAEFVDAEIGIAEETGTYHGLRGVNYAPIMAVEEGKLKITEGRTFSTNEMEQGTPVVVLSEQFASVNNLQVGSIISLKNDVYRQLDVESIKESDLEVPQEPIIIQSRDLHLEVIGIFSLGPNWSQDGDSSSKTSVEASDEEWIQQEIFNTLYTPIKVVQSENDFYKSSVEADQGKPLDGYSAPNTPIFALNSVDDVESFTQAANQEIPNFYVVQSAQSLNEKSLNTLKTIQSITNTSLIVVLLAALAIISLVIVLSLRDRRHELGIYSALGRPKAAIVTQILIEVLVVALVGLAIAILAGTFIAGSLSDVLFSSQFDSKSATESTDTVYSIGLYGEQALMMGGVDLDSVIANHSISMSPTHIILLLGAGIGTVLLSCVLPIVYLLRLKPKKILM